MQRSEDFVIDDIENKPTPHLDEVRDKVKKLLNATMASFIPEAFEALKKDWFPNLTHDQIKQNSGIRNLIRQKILSEYCIEHSETGIWKEKSFDLFMPDWLKDPFKQHQSKDSIIKAREASIKSMKSTKNFVQKVEMDRRKLENLITHLPEMPKPLQDEIEGNAPETITPQVPEEPLETTQQQEDPAEQKQSAIAWYDHRLNQAENSIMTALSDNKAWGVSNDEYAIADRLKKSKEFRKSLFYELGNYELNTHYSKLKEISALVDDALDVIAKAKAKK